MLKRITERSALTLELLQAVLDYDSQTGIFTWKVKLSNNTNVGEIAGHRNKINGYYELCIHNIKFHAHKLAWMYVYGVYPDFVDHKNRNRSDNRISNLRLGDECLNTINSKRRKDNTSGYKGVGKKGYRWFARITVRGKITHLGMFDTKEQAAKAYNAAALEYYGEYACLNVISLRDLF